ncbi:MAG: GNAT family N-acetyltransferase [Bacteroidia bacterium]
MNHLTFIKKADVNDCPQLLTLWNQEYPLNLQYQSLADFQKYLQSLENAKHFLWVDEGEQVKAWAFTFDREKERWFAIILSEEVQGLGYGRKIMALLQETENELNGWVTDHQHYIKMNGQPYLSPMGFYEKCGFSVLMGQRLELPQLSAVKIHWKKCNVNIMEIIAQTAENLDSFWGYLQLHVAENGQNGHLLFLPLGKAHLQLNKSWKEKFEEDLKKELEEMGWRRLWLAKNQAGQIMGHIDIRSHNQLHTQHRVVLGMGVDSHFRGQKVGQSLMEFILHFCQQNPQIAWIDLEVIASNPPAIALYKKMGFEETGRKKDMFKIDGLSYDYISMSLDLALRD